MEEKDKNIKEVETIENVGTSSDMRQSVQQNQQQTQNLENKALNVNFNQLAKDAKNKLDTIVKTEDTTNHFTKEDIEANRVKALLSYVFPPIPYLDKNSSPFTKYHACQGMNLFIVAVGYFLLRIILTALIKEQQVCGTILESEIFCRVTPNWVLIPLNIIGLLLTALAVLGICNVLLGKAVALPVVSKLNLFKSEG